MDEFADNPPDLTPLYDAKSLCEEFARLKGYRLRLVKYAWHDHWFVRLKYGDYNLKYFDGPCALTKEGAYELFAEWLCDPDEHFDPGNFKGWSHFGKCSCPAELGLRMAAFGGGA